MAKKTEKPPAHQAVAQFEQKLSEINCIVECMEAGNLSLEEALKQFERGIGLTRECQQALAVAEQKVNVLLADNGDSSGVAVEAKDKKK